MTVGMVNAERPSTKCAKDLFSFGMAGATQARRVPFTKVFLN